MVSLQYDFEEPSFIIFKCQFWQVFWKLGFLVQVSPNRPEKDKCLPVVKIKRCLHHPRHRHASHMHGLVHTCLLSSWQIKSCMNYWGYHGLTFPCHQSPMTTAMSDVNCLRRLSCNTNIMEIISMFYFKMLTLLSCALPETFWKPTRYKRAQLCMCAQLSLNMFKVDDQHINRNAIKSSIYTLLKQGRRVTLDKVASARGLAQKWALWRDK